MLQQEFIGVVETDGESKVSFNHTHLKREDKIFPCITSCHATKEPCLLLSYMHSGCPLRRVHSVLVPRLQDLVLADALRIRVIEEA